MYKNPFLPIILIALFVVGGIFVIFLVRQPSAKPSSDTPVRKARLHIVATIFPLYDITRIVAGDVADVDLLLPPGASPHLFSFTPRQLAKLQDVAVAFGIGHGLDNWAYDALSAIHIPMVTVDKNITLLPSADNDDGPDDPHYWLDLHNAQIITQTIADTLAQQDPTHADTYQQNARDYIHTLQQEDALFQKRVAQLPHKEIITLHDAWYYFANYLGLTIAGTFEPRAGESPSPQYLARLGQATREHSNGVIFTEPQLATDTIRAFAKDHHLKIAILDPLGGTQGRTSYLAMMRYNIETLINALTSH